MVNFTLAIGSNKHYAEFDGQEEKKDSLSKSCGCNLMSDLSQPDHMTDMAVELGIQRGEWGSGKHPSLYW